jgi:hypothetical protein
MPDLLATLISGPLVEPIRLPMTLPALLCDLCPRFIPKSQVGRGYRAVARNGRVLLASDLPLPELAGVQAQVRLQIWHKVILPDDPPSPYGLLLCIRTGKGADSPVLYRTRLVRRSGSAGPTSAGLTLDVGGGMELEFHRTP